MGLSARGVKAREPLSTSLRGGVGSTGTPWRMLGATDAPHARGVRNRGKLGVNETTAGNTMIANRTFDDRDGADKMIINDADNGDNRDLVKMATGDQDPNDDVDDCEVGNRPQHRPLLLSM